MSAEDCKKHIKELTVRDLREEKRLPYTPCFDLFVLSYWEWMRRWLMKSGHLPNEDAKDIAQNAVIKFNAALDTGRVDPDQKAKSLLWNMCLHRAFIDYLRWKYSLPEELFSDIEQSGAEPGFHAPDRTDSEALLRMEAQYLWDVLRQSLSPTEFSTVTAHFWEEKTFREIASGLGVSTSEAYKTWQDALEKVSETLKRMGLHEGRQKKVERRGRKRKASPDLEASPD